MKTIVKKVSDGAVEEAAALLQKGNVVAVPTETVYGLAANAFDEDAVGKIFKAKGRPQDNPLIVHIADFADLPRVAAEIPCKVRLLAEAFWPGPLTLVLPRQPALARGVSAGLGTVGVRLPAHEAARQLIRAAGVPLAAPSANLSGSPSPTAAAHVLADMDGRIPFILDGGASPVGVESTVLSLVSAPMVLRPGFVTPDELAAVLGEPVLLSVSIETSPAEGLVPESPGMKYRHYAPKAKMTILDADFETFCRFLAVHKEEDGVFALCFDAEADKLPVPAISYGRESSAASQAAALFAALRELDDRGAKIVYARKPNSAGVGLAVRNRLLRASGFREMQL